VSVEIVFETHSTTEDNEAGRATGWLGGRLSAAGRRQAAELGERRRDDGITAVFSSDLARARETVELAFQGSSVPILFDWRLRECDYGEENGAAVERVRAELHRRLTEPFPGGESWQEAIHRVQRAVGDIRDRGDGWRVLVVGHVATYWGLELLVSGRPIEDLEERSFTWRPGWEFVIR